MKKNNLKHYLLLLAVGVSSVLCAQVNIGKYIFYGGVVRAIVNTPDGSTYLGGDFTSIILYSGHGVSIDPSTGVWDETYAKVDGAINSVIHIPEELGGGWYIGGEFTHINGYIRNRLARINADGTLHDFDPNIGLISNNAVFALALDASGNLYVGGYFTVVGGSTTRNHLAKYNHAGVLTDFDPNMNNSVRALVVDPDGKLYVGGNFTRIGGSITRNRLAKFDTEGALTSFDPNISGGSFGNTFVLSLLLDSNGNLYVGGSFSIVGAPFTSSGGSYRNRLAKFDESGVLTSFDPNMSNSVRALAVDASGNLYAGGDFTSVGGISRNRLAKFDVSGVLTLFNPNMNDIVRSLAVDTGGNLYIGGDFDKVYGAITRNRLAKFDASGVLTDFDPNMSNLHTNSVRTLTFNQNGNLYAGGYFTTVGESTRRNRLAKFDASGVLTDFDPNMNDGFTHTHPNVSSLVLDANGNLYVGGDFTRVGDSTRNRLAKFDALGVLTSFDPNMNSTVYSLAFDASDNLYVGGNFTSVGGTSRNRIAKFDTSGVLTSFDPNMDNSVRALAFDGSGNLYVGGFFTRVGGLIIRNCLAKFDALGVLTSFDPNMNGSLVTSLTVDASGNLYAGGSFTRVGGTTRNRLAKFNALGVLTSFDPNMNSDVYSLVLDANGNLYVGGGFTTVGGLTNRYRIAKFDTSGVLTNFAPHMNGQVRALAFDASGNLHVGGGFTFNYIYYELCTTLDNSLTVNSLTLTSNADGATYQWLDCDNGNAPILGEINQSFTATGTGNYAVEVIQDGCVATSACIPLTIVGITENSFVSSYTVYPNPTTGQLNIDLGANTKRADIIVRNFLGQEIVRKSYTSTNLIGFTLEGEAGLYFVEIIENDKKTALKVIKN